MKFATHWNGNLLCAVDTETTGLECGKHEVIQVCVMPLTINYEPNTELGFFDLLIRPEMTYDYEEANKVNKGKVVQAINMGMERWTAVQRFEEWFASLNLAKNKGIIPLGCNYGFDKGFIAEWLGGPANYDNFFRYDYRDVQRVASYLNDVAYYRQQPIPFPKFSLRYLCSTLGVAQISAHDAVSDCVATAEVYKKLLRRAQ